MILKLPDVYQFLIFFRQLNYKSQNTLKKIAQITFKIFNIVEFFLIIFLKSFIQQKKIMKTFKFEQFNN